MGKYIAQEVIKLMIKKGIIIKNSNILILGITFKENCPDVRNTKVVDIIKALNEYNLNIVVFDPWANPEDAKQEYNIEIVNKLPKNHQKFDAIILAVAHNEYLNINLNKYKKNNCIIYDAKSVLQNKYVDKKL
jgi:UDP-N-acetyl-D-galactosamine dehydrogenase